jgi:hypothetical protein
MTALHNDVFDKGLETVDDNTEKLHICSADPGLTFSNIAAFGLGVKDPPTIAAPSDRSGGGREIVVSAITDGLVTGTGTGTYFALTDDSESKILVSQKLVTPVALTSGMTFRLTSLAIGMPDPAEAT